jgi:flagellar motor switch/type III secretory pathway protein FliN
VDDNWCGLLKPVETAVFGTMLLDAAEEEITELASSTLLRETAQQALLELAQRLLAGNQPSYDNVPFFSADNQLPESAEMCGSGAIVLRIKVGTLVLDYIVSPLTVERYIEAVVVVTEEKSRQLVEVSSAIGNQKVNAKVLLGSAELSLGELSSIRIGDVVTLDKCIDEPALMEFGVNGDACEGFIGKKGGSLAFRLSHVENHNSK